MPFVSKTDKSSAFITMIKTFLYTIQCKMYYNVGIVHKYNLLHIRKYQAEI